MNFKNSRVTELNTDRPSKIKNDVYKGMPMDGRTGRQTAEQTYEPTTTLLYS